MVKLKEVVAFKHQTERSDRQLKMVLRQASATISGAVKDEPAELLIKVEVDPPVIVSDIDEKPDDLLEHFDADSSNDCTYGTRKTEVLARNDTLKMSRRLRTELASSMRQTKDRQHSSSKPIKQKKPPKLHMKLYACAHCKRVCKRRHRFMEHLTVHGFPVKFPCTRCDQGMNILESFCFSSTLYFDCCYRIRKRCNEGTRSPAALNRTRRTSVPHLRQDVF